MPVTINNPKAVFPKRPVDNAAIAQAALDSGGLIASTEKGAAGGVSPLGEDGKIPESILDPLVVATTTALGTGQIMSKCRPDGTNQSSRFVDEVMAAAAAGKTLMLPFGVINLQGLSATIAVSGLRLSGPAGGCILDAGVPTYVALFTPTGGDVILENIGFRRWQYPLLSSAALSRFEMRRCGLIENRGHVQLQDRSDYPLSSAESIFISECWVQDSPGFALKGATSQAVVTHNRMLRVRRNYDLWDSADHVLYGICVGDHDDVAPEIAQKVTQRIIVSENIIRGVSNGSVSSGTCKGIVVTGESVSITSNSVDSVSVVNETLGHEGIYVKTAFGQISGNLLTDATQQSCALAIKGKRASAPIGKQLQVHHNKIRSINQVTSKGITIFGSADDITVEDNEIYGAKDIGISVHGSPIKNQVLRNKLVGCGGIPIYWACGDIENCEISGNDISDQIMPTASDLTRLNSPLPSTGPVPVSGIFVGAYAGKLKSIAVTEAGSGYLVDGSPNGGAFVQLTGGGGSGGSVYCTFENGSLVSAAVAAEGGGYSSAPTVNVGTSVTPGVVISHPTGTNASAAATLSAGTTTRLTIDKNKFSGTYQYDAAKAANGYECVTLYNDDNTNSGEVTVDGINCKIGGAHNASNEFNIWGLSLRGAIQTGSARGISMMGANPGLRQKPWRSNGSENLASSFVFRPQFILHPAETQNGLVIPLSAIFYRSSGIRIIIAFNRFFAATTSGYLGTIQTGTSIGSLVITKVTPRYVLRSGGSALSASSGTPTVAVGTSTGGSNIIPATAISSISNISSPIDGQKANELTVASLNVPLYLTIAGGAIASNNSAFLCIDIDLTNTP